MTIEIPKNVEAIEVVGLKEWIDEHDKQIRAEAIDEFAHILKETFNNKFPSNYHCTQPYFTLDNVRVLTDAVAKELKEQK